MALLNRRLSGAQCGCSVRSTAGSPALVSRVVVSRLPQASCAGVKHRPLHSLMSGASRDVSLRATLKGGGVEEPSAPFQAHMKQLLADNSEVTVAVIGAKVQGLMVMFGDHEGFAASTSLGDLFKNGGQDLVGTNLNVTVSGYDKRQGKWMFKLVGSQKVGELQAGEVVTGTWGGIKKWGGFVTLDGCEGLVHSSRFSRKAGVWLNDHVQTGTPVKAFVLQVDNAAGRIMLSTALLEGAPGDMVSSPQAVYDAADETGAALRAKFQAASRSAAGPLDMAEFNFYA